MRRISTLLEVGRRHILNALHLRGNSGNNRSPTAKVLGLSAPGLGIGAPQRKEAGFAAPVSLARDEGSKDNAAGQDHETATVNVIEELISLVEAIGERGRPGDDEAGQLNRRKAKT